MPRRTFRRVLTGFWLTAGLVSPPVPAAAAPETPDKIVFADEKRGEMEVTITKETYKEIAGMLQGSAQSYPLEEVKEVIHADPPHNFVAGEDHRAQGDWAAAESAYEKAASGAGAKPWVRQYSYYYVAWCRLQQGQFEKALAGYDRLLKEFSDTRFFLEAYRERFDCLMALHQAANAVQVASDLRAQASGTGMKTWPRYADAMEATALMAQQKYKEAADKYAPLAAEKDPQLRKVGLSGLMAALSMLKDWGRLRPQAIAGIQKETDPDLLAGAYNALGDADLGEGKTREALLDYLRVIVQLSAQKISPGENARALYGAGQACAKMAEGMADKAQKETYRERAVQNFKELVNRFPDSSQAKNALNDLRKLGP